MLIVVSAVESTIDYLIRYISTAKLSTTNLYFIVLFFDYIARVKGVLSFKHITSCRL